MKLFNWINPLWIIETFLTTRLEPVSATTAAMSAPSILAGTGSTLTGAGMMTAAAPVVPGILSSATPGVLGSLGALGSAGLQYAKDNPFQTAGLGLGIYDRMNAQPQQMQAPQLGIIRPQQTGQYQPTLQARIPQAMYPRRLV
jgi:hypothetical protein